MSSYFGVCDAKPICVKLQHCVLAGEDCDVHIGITKHMYNFQVNLR